MAYVAICRCFARLRNMIENSSTQGEIHRVELNLRDVNQLFNTIDPSPFQVEVRKRG